MKREHDPKLTTDMLERDLQELFRKREWAKFESDPAEFKAAINATSQFAPELLENSLRKLDAWYGIKPQIAPRRYWTHPSVLALTLEDPIKAIAQRAREIVLEALEAGWTGPPYDPFALAEYLGIRILPTGDVIDARTYGTASGKFTIEFNPDRPPARIRYSVAHELAHTFFPDCAAAIRNRATHEQMLADEWQLEMLCNIAASEILIPLGSLGENRETRPSVSKVLDLRRKFQVSFEAMMLRLIRVTDYECFAFAARHDGNSGKYRLDYRISSAGWRSAPRLESGLALPRESAASECTAIGYTSKNEEKWLPNGETWSIEYLGIPPYPGHVRPRVIGIASPVKGAVASQSFRIKYLRGDASDSRGSGKNVIVQVVNDRAITWGAGFSSQIRKKWPRAQVEFKDWALTNRQEFKLGRVHFVQIDDSTTLASLIAQHGYGPADHPRIRYNALANSLRIVAEKADAMGATIQMPRIGSGLGGGSWEIVEEIVEESLCRRGLRVTVYDLPDEQRSLGKQGSLVFGRRTRE